MILTNENGYEDVSFSEWNRRLTDQALALMSGGWSHEDGADALISEYDYTQEEADKIIEIMEEMQDKDE